MSHDLLVGATSLRTFGNIASFDDVLRDPPRRGGNLDYPGVAGAVFVAKVAAAYVMTVPLTISTATDAAMHDQLDDLRALLACDTAPLTLTRVRTTGSGVVSETCQADCPNGVQPALAVGTFARLALELVNLDGAWTPV